MVKLLFLGLAGSLAAILAANPANATALVEGPTSLGIDVAPAGNGATSLDSLQSCRSVEIDSTFDVDVFIDGVVDLRTWELSVAYDPAQIEVADAQEMFLSANAGSNVLFPALEPLPDIDGRFRVGAIDISHSSDSGSGVLVRLTLRAKSSGIGPLGLPMIDINNDGKMDLGPSLNDAEGETIGDTTGDGFFDGPTHDAQIAVGVPCPDSSGQDDQAGSQPSSGQTSDEQAGGSSPEQTPEEQAEEGPAGSSGEAGSAASLETTGAEAGVAATPEAALPVASAPESSTPSPGEPRTGSDSTTSDSNGTTWAWRASSIGIGVLGLLGAGLLVWSFRRRRAQR